MKISLIIVSLLMFSISVFAFKNPQILACRLAQGQFLVMNTVNDQVGLCKFDLSIVGSVDVLNKDARIEVPLSLHNYKKGTQACSLQNRATLISFEGEKISVCQYSDGSIIDIETLASGKNTNRNLKLNQFLGL